MASRIIFHGAVGGVTGSCFLLEAAGKRILLDCGLFQGGGQERLNLADFPFEPQALDAVILSHAHLDHSGRLPLLVRQGYSGPIFAHRATRDLCSILLKDAAFLEERRAAARGDQNEASADDGRAEPLFDQQDVAATLEQFRLLDYQRVYEILPDIRLRFGDAGHIIGAAISELRILENGAERRLVYSGDLGHRGGPMMPDWQPVEQADLVLIESTYGDRLHRSRRDTEREISEILRTAHKEQGNILVPAFAVGRTQELLYLFGRHYRDWKMDRWKVFLDSPMAIQATEVHARHAGLYRAEAAEWVKSTGFRFPGLYFTENVEQSMALNRIQEGAIIIAGSGMCNGGRIRHHLKHQLWKAGTRIMITGFQAQGTPGRLLVDGSPELEIDGDTVPVRARVDTIGGISAHADQGELIEWLRGFTLPPRLVLVHGEDSAREGLAAAIRNQLTVDPEVPGPGDSLEL